jgi:hypothetical protein
MKISFFHLLSSNEKNLRDNNEQCLMVSEIIKAPFQIKKTEPTQGVSFGSSAILIKIRRFPSRPYGRFGFVRKLLIKTPMSGK